MSGKEATTLRWGDARARIRRPARVHQTTWTAHVVHRALARSVGCACTPPSMLPPTAHCIPNSTLSPRERVIEHELLLSKKASQKVVHIYTSMLYVRLSESSRAARDSTKAYELPSPLWPRGEHEVEFAHPRTSVKCMLVDPSRISRHPHAIAQRHAMKENTIEATVRGK